MAANALVNGINISWSNIICIIGGIPVVGITVLNYANRTTGNVTIYYHELKRLAASAPEGDIRLLPAFTVQIIFDGTVLEQHREFLKDVQFTADPFTNPANDDCIKIVVPISIGSISKV